jgi:outer membrane protein, heavy metal efflux system
MMTRSPLTRICKFRTLALAGLACACVPGAARADEEPLLLSHLPSGEGLVARLWSKSPEVLAARLRAEQAKAEEDRAGRLPNPVLDASWNTIPVGESNPPDLESPMVNVPNYQVGLSTLVELGKRSPRKRAARGNKTAAILDASEALRQVYLNLLVAAGRVATAQERIAVLEAEVVDAARLTTLAHDRAAHGDLAKLDEVRASLEETKLRSLLSEGRQQLAEALLECGRLAGTRCEPFTASADAHAFLTTHSEPPPEAELRGALSARPDLQSLAAQEESALAAGELAKARRIPDPTVRLGYTRDQFVVAGNQKHSVGVGLAIPLPLSERGQSDAAIARATATTAHDTRVLREGQAGRDLDRLLESFRALTLRQRAMHTEYLPLAQSLVARMTASVKAGGATIADLLLARRSYNELLADASDLDRAVFEAAISLLRTSGARSFPPPSANHGSP